MTFIALLFCLVEQPDSFPHPGCLPVGEYRTGAEVFFEAESFCSLFRDRDQCYAALYTKKVTIDEKLVPVLDLVDGQISKDQ